MSRSRALLPPPSTTPGCTRRQALAHVAAASLVGLAGRAGAQGGAVPPASALRAVGVYALMGDTMQVVLSEDPEMAGGVFNRTEDMNAPGLGLDAIVLRLAKDALDTMQPSPRQHLFRATEPITLTEQRNIADGARRSALPAWIVRAVEEHQLSHVLLVTRHRGPAQFRRPDGTVVGRGTVEGIGFYIDPVYQPRNLLTGAPPVGALGVYADLRLSLFDTDTATVVAEHHARAGQMHPPANEAQGLEPWSILDSRRKVQALREMVEATVRRDLPQVLPI